MAAIGARLEMQSSNVAMVGPSNNNEGKMCDQFSEKIDGADPIQSRCDSPSEKTGCGSSQNSDDELCASDWEEKPSMPQGKLPRKRWSSYDSDSDDDFLPAVPVPVHPRACADDMKLLGRVAAEPCGFPNRNTTACVLPQAVRLQFARVVAAGLGALKEVPWVKSTTVQESISGWSVVGNSSAEELRDSASFDYEPIKKAVLEAAEVSKNVYVAGYEGNPFMKTPGCSDLNMNLMFVIEDDHTCWDVIMHGNCPRGSSCCQFHPRYQVCAQYSIVSSA